MVVSHNMMTLGAQRQFNINAESKKKTVEKLASGYKINRAADDAAGLTISEEMRRQIRGLERGTTNCEEGVSLCQVADGAMAEVHDMLQRINVLCVQAANGTNSDSDRESINDEIIAIKKEIDRVGNETKFNEIRVLQGESTHTYWEEELVTITYTEKAWVEVELERVTEMSLVEYTNIGAKIPSDLIMLNRQSVQSGVKTGAMLSQSQNADELKLSRYDAAFNLDFSNVKTRRDWGILDGYGFTVNCSFTQCVGKTTFVFDDSKTGFTHMTPGIDVRSPYEENVFVIGTKEFVSGEDFVNAFSEFVVGLGRGGFFSDDDRLEGTITGNELIICISNKRSSTEHGYLVVGEPMFDYTTEKVKEMQYVDVERTREEMRMVEKRENHKMDLYIQHGVSAYEGLSIRLPHIDCAALEMEEINVLSEDAVVDALEAVERVIGKVSAERGRMGAYTNRLEHLINNQNNVIENTQAAESRIRDMDMAEELVNLSTYNILEQAGFSVMSQANQSATMVLELLKG